MRIHTMFSTCRSPSLESIASSSPAHPTDNMLVSPPKERPSDASSLSQTMDDNMRRPPDRKRGRYYLPTENVVFLVENELYSVHRYFFQYHSSHFAAKFSENPSQGLTDDNPISLEGVTVAAFDLFLSILYPPELGKYTGITIAEWVAIFDLATKWMFESIRALAINQLALIASPIDRIILGRKYHILEWLSGAYQAVCSRPDPLTEKESMRLGIRDTVKISAIRQAYGTSQPRFSPTLLPGDLDKIFGLKTAVESGGAPVILPEERRVDQTCIAGSKSPDEEGREIQQLEANKCFDFVAYGGFGSTDTCGAGINQLDWEQQKAEEKPTVSELKDVTGEANKPLTKAQKKKRAKERLGVELYQMERVAFFS